MICPCLYCASDCSADERSGCEQYADYCRSYEIVSALSKSRRKKKSRSPTSGKAAKKNEPHILYARKKEKSRKNE